VDERINSGYAAGQLARALRTAADETGDLATRQRAEDRAASWTSVLRGMCDGTLSIGSREPVDGLPVWATPKVVRGGFATGEALADEPWGDDETARAEALGLPQSRTALFASWLTDEGLAELTTMLDERTYQVTIAEDAALLVVAWLVRAGATDAAWHLIDTLDPVAGWLRFTPRAGTARRGPGDVVARRTAAQAGQALAQVRPHRGVETQREVLNLWLPLTDDFLALWWDTRVDGVVGRRWTDEHTGIAQALVARYDEALTTSPCRKYRNPKENLPILVAATREWMDAPDQCLARQASRPGDRARAAQIVADMVAKRGEPGSDRLTALRQVQATVAGVASRAQLATVASDRLFRLPADAGVDDVAAVLRPVTDAEADQFSMAAGVTMPPVVERNVRLATAAPVEDLVAQGVVPSAEVLAELVPDLTAQQVGASYDDPTLGHLMALTYQAFRRRRSLLLLGLAHQVQFAELPWVAAVADHAVGRPDDPVAVGRRLCALAIDAFPATILPNPLISELSTLLKSLSIPLTEELAADLFLGRFSPKFPRAARLAAQWLDGSLYQRYYDVPWAQMPPEAADTRAVDAELLRVINTADRAQLQALWGIGLVTAGRIVAARPFSSLDELDRLRGVGPASAAQIRQHFGANSHLATQWFADLCARGVPSGSRWSVAGNGMVIERQQQMTTHNLAVLLGTGGVVPTRPWADLATDALATMVHLLVVAQTQARPLSTIKDAAYALRQGLVFASRTDEATLTAIVDTTAAVRGADTWPVTDVLTGIRHIAAGGSFSPNGTCPGGHRLTGWTVSRHWAAPSR